MGREDNGVTDYTYVYTYDNAGNITSKKSYGYTTSTLGSVRETKTYGYTDSTWGDLLTSLNGTTIVYDEIGNPLNYSNIADFTFTWEGRRLVGASRPNNAISFEYNSDGLRTSKTLNGVTTTYYLDGDRIVGEEKQRYSCTNQNHGKRISKQSLLSSKGSQWG